MAAAATAVKEYFGDVKDFNGLLQKLGSTYEWVLAQGDPRVRTWFLMNPLHCLGLIAAYLLIVFTLMRVMTKREPFKLRLYSTCHNIILTVLSFYMFVEAYYCAFIDQYSLFGNGVDTSDKGIRMARIIHIFYCSKVLEFNDTIIMCLKKNFHQISFLHVYHHASIFAIWWIVTYFAPGGESYFSAGLNSFIHVLMYGYYLWSTFAKKTPEGVRPKWNEPGYYKKYVTSLQMLQFTCMFIQSNYDLFIVKDNKYPKWIAWILFVYMLTMLGLFANFFIKAYGAEGKKKQEKRVNVNTENGASSTPKNKSSTPRTPSTATSGTPKSRTKKD